MLIPHQFSRQWFQILMRRKLTNRRLQRGSPVRVVWPLPVSEIPSVAAGTTAVAKNEGEQMVRPEAHVETTGQTENSPQPRERTSESPRVTPSTVFLFLAIGLPWVGVLAWLGITANSARGERLVRNHLQLKATGHLDYDKRGVDRLDDQREANRMDEFLANVAQSLKTSSRNRLLHRQNTYHRIRKRLKRRAQDCGLPSDTERAEV
jgi:hypothetical protein